MRAWTSTVFLVGLGLPAQGLAGIDGIEVISSDNPELSSAIVSFSLRENVSNGDVFRAMRDKDITIKRLPQYNAVRISNHMFTTNRDVDQMVSLLQEFLI